MISFLNLPKLPYILFELFRYPILNSAVEGRRGSDVNNSISGPPEQAAVVVMDVLPTVIDYNDSSKKSFTTGPGDNNANSDHAGVGPTAVSLEGTFGARIITRGLKFQDGFGRLKEFRKLFDTSQSVKLDINTDPFGPKSYTYGLNFYDFTMHRWGACDLDTFRVRGDARTHSKLPTYTISFTMVKKLISVESSDPLLRSLKYVIEAQDKLDEFNTDLENFINNNSFLNTADNILVNIDLINNSISAVGEVMAEYTTAVLGSTGAFGTVQDAVSNSLFTLGDLIS